MSNQTHTFEIHGFTYSSISFCEAQGLAKCFQAYADNAKNEDIMSIGFNPNSGYTYIALENGISICSMLGRDVEYLVTNLHNGNETFYDSYTEAAAHEDSNDDENED
jgi:hypothetical protein